MNEIEKRDIMQNPAASITPKVNIDKLFSKINAIDYAALWFLSANLADNDTDTKIYIKDICDSMKLPLERVTGIIRSFESKGLVIWTHDDGHDGTYIKITDYGVEQILEQRELLDNVHRNVIESYGEEKFMELITGLFELEDIINKEIEKRN